MKAPPLFKLWPSIDLRRGRVVRLLRGEAGAETLYPGTPEAAARIFAAEGADGIHIVDLDGAFGEGENEKAITAILDAVSIPIQVGGGLRSREAIEKVLALGASRVVLGSLPYTEPALFAELLGDHRTRIVVALDCRDGRPSILGWTVDAAAGDVAEAASKLREGGVSALLVTDIARDGAMEGPNLELLARVRSVFQGEILASGGMRGEQDLEGVATALREGPAGAIFGRSLHDGTTDVARLVRARAGMAPASGGGVE